MKMKPVLGTKLNTAHRLNQGLVGCWLMNERAGNGIQDISGSGFNGILTGGMTRTPNHFGGGLVGSGANGGVDLTEYNAKITPARITVSAWVKKNSANRRIVCADSNSGSGRSYILKITSAAAIEWDVWNQSGSFGQAAGGVLDSEWRLVTGTWGGTTVRAYIDSVEVSNAALSGTSIRTSVAAYMWFGCQGGTNEEWDGNMDEVRIYNRALSASEVKELYELKLK